MGAINNKDLLQRFLEYIAIDSETGDELNMAIRLKEDFLSLGCEVYTDDIKEVAKTSGFNVYATLKGDEGAEPIIFNSHMDTVVPGLSIKATVCDDGFVRSDGTTILGGDDKAGIAAIVEAMKAVSDIPHRTIEAVITVREESGMFGSKNLEYSRLKSKKAVVLDSSGGPYDIIVGAPGQNKISVSIIGKKAHAGVAPEEGISAIQVAADAVSKMKLLRVDEETTCNIGTFKSEGPTNIVTERTELVLEVRSRNTEKLIAHTKHLTDCIESSCEKFGAKCEIDVATSYLGYHLSDDNPLVKMVFDATEKLGLGAKTKMSGGGSDANIFNQKGIEAVNLGVGMQKAHTTDEQLCIKDMEDAAAVCLEIMKI